MKVRNTRSGIRSAPEEDPPRPVWSRIAYWIYVSVLISIVGAAIWYGIREYSSFEAQGQVRTDRTLVSVQRDGRIEKIFAEVGDTVVAGDPLLRVNPGVASACTPEDQSSLRDLRRQIARNRLQVQQLRESRSRVLKELVRLREQSTLELGTSDTRRKRLEDRVFQIRQEIKRSRQQIQLSRSELRSLRERPTADPECMPYTISVPRNGRVQRVLHSAQSFVQEGEAILSLTPEPVSASVHAYLDTDLAEYVRRGDTLTVSLPDGTQSKGVIQRLYSSALEFTQIKYDGYRPLYSQLLALVAPVGSSTKQRWSSFDRMDVRVSVQIGAYRFFSSSPRDSTAGPSPLGDTPPFRPSPDTVQPQTRISSRKQWTIVTGSFAEPEDAQSALQSLRGRLDSSLGIQIRIDSTRTTTRHRVTVGEFQRKQQARSAIADHLIPEDSWLLEMKSKTQRNISTQ